MYDIKTIKHMNNEASEKAEKSGLLPYIAEKDYDEKVKSCKRLGDYIPKGYKIVNTYFVDNSGFGSESEPALTFRQFLNKVRKGFGYAIGEVGQFQLYINEYQKV